MLTKYQCPDICASDTFARKLKKWGYEAIVEGSAVLVEQTRINTNVVSDIAADMGAHTVKPTAFDCDAWGAK